MENDFYHLKTGSTISEYSFDAWGRRRNDLNWSYDLTGQPALFADRGFTSHEFLSDFNLYNMNGRLYDPMVGRFLSPDPYIQDPSFSQSYNRYSYALNNQLKFTDYSGEKWKWNYLNPFYHFQNFMQWVNDKTPQLRQNMVKMGVPDFGVNYNTMFGTGFSVGENPAYYPFYENRIVKGQQGISNQLAGFRGMESRFGDWFSDHFFAEIEFRIDKGMQGNIQVEALGAMLGVGYENNTEPIVQINLGFDNKFYWDGYSFDNPKYGYGGVIDPIRNSRSGAFGAGARNTYESRRGLFIFGVLESENINWGAINIKKLYDTQGKVTGSQYYWGFGFDFSAIYGISFDLNLGYKKIHK